MREIKYFAFTSDTTLTNYYPCKITFGGITYQSSEAIYQSRKTIDSTRWAAYANLTPEESKRMGRSEVLRSDWNDVKFQIMYSAIEAKFEQVPEFREELMSTGDAILIEDTTGWHDNTWGICSCEACKNKPYSNLLGLALTVLRETKKAEMSKGTKLADMFK